MRTTYAEKRIEHPNYYYETPSRVLADRGLTKTEKRRVLDVMKRNAELLTAPRIDTRNANACVEIGDVDKAIVALDQEIAG